LKTLVFTRSPEFAKLATDEAGRTFDPITPAQVDENFKAETNRLTDIAPLTSEQFLQTAGQLVRASCKEAGVIGYELLAEGENRFAFLERYTDADAVAAHLKTDHYRTLGRQTGQYMVGKPEVLKITPAF